jgi:hypothetical protein
MMFVLSMSMMRVLANHLRGSQKSYIYDEVILEEIMEEKAGAFEREDMQSHDHRVVVSSLTNIEAIIEEKTNVGSLEVIEEDFVVLEQLNIPSSPCVPLVASSSLDGDPYTFDAPNVEEEKYEDAYAGDSDEDHHVPNVEEEGSDGMYEEESDEETPAPKFSEKETDAYVKVFGKNITIHEFKDVREADQAVADSNLREYAPEQPRPLTMDEVQNQPRARPLIYEGLKFKTMLDLQVWLQEYAVIHHRPFIVFKSDKNQRYVVLCENEECPWKV